MTPEQIYREYYTLFLAIVGPRLRDPDDAHDVVHDAFLRIFARMDQYDPAKGSLRNWIWTIMIHEAIDRNRNWRYRHEPLGDWTGNVQNMAISRLACAEILRQISRLPRMQRSVVMSHCVEDRPHKEVAGDMRITQGSTKYHLHHGR